jgi:hypothetical protein
MLELTSFELLKLRSSGPSFDKVFVLFDRLLKSSAELRRSPQARDCVSQSLPNSEVFVFAISNDVLNTLFFGVDSEGLHTDSREEEQMGDGDPPAFDPDVLGKFLSAIFNHYGFQIGSINLQLFLL